MCGKIVAFILYLVGGFSVLLGFVILLGSITIKGMPLSQTEPIFDTLINPGLLELILGVLVDRFLAAR